MILVSVARGLTMRNDQRRSRHRRHRDLHLAVCPDRCCGVLQVSTYRETMGNWRRRTARHQWGGRRRRSCSARGSPFGRSCPGPATGPAVIVPLTGATQAAVWIWSARPSQRLFAPGPGRSHRRRVRRAGGLPTRGSFSELPARTGHHVPGSGAPTMNRAANVGRSGQGARSISASKNWASCSRTRLLELRLRETPPASSCLGPVRRSVSAAVEPRPDICPGGGGAVVLVIEVQMASGPGTRKPDRARLERRRPGAGPVYDRR